MKFYMLIVNPGEKLQSFGDEDMPDRVDEAMDYLFNEAERNPHCQHILFNEKKVVIGSWQAGHWDCVRNE